MTNIPNEIVWWVLIGLGGLVLGLLIAWLTGAARRREAAELELELDEQREQVVRLTGERAILQGRLERLAQIESELKAAHEEAQRLREASQRAEQQATALGTRLQEQNQAAQEKVALLERIREEFSDKFKVLSGDLLEKQSLKFTEQNRTNLGTLLNPLREQLGDFRKTVTEVYDKESRERVLLKAEIDSLKTLNQRIDEDARNLTRALTRDSKTQGAWGELVLERLLEASGLQQGREYEMQTSFSGAEGGRLRPDVIVHLPENRDLVIDAKVSLTAYERYCASADDAERKPHLQAHLLSLRNHVKELAGKSYAELPGVNSLDFVLMFVPVEAAYIEAVHHDDALQAFALEKQVVIVTTSTLLATLRTVSNIWKFDDQNRNALEIARRGGLLYDKFVGFVDDIEAAKKRVGDAAEALQSASDKLSTGRGNLVGQVEKLRELGARNKRSLRDAVDGRLELDDEPNSDDQDADEESD